MGCGSSKVGSVVHINHEISSRTQQSSSHGQVERVENLEMYSSKQSVSNESFKQRKKKLIPNVEIFKKADERALQAPASKLSCKELVNLLTEPFQDSDLMKLRVIWSWVTHNIVYDVDSYFDPSNQEHSDVDAKNVLGTGKAVCSGYASVCKYMTNLAGLRVETITGWAKGFSYVTGTSFSDQNTNHAWNAVYLADSWWLLDSTWSAGYVDTNKNFIQKYNEHFFFTNPEEFIYDHLPEDFDWQLLDTPISMKAYENLAKFSTDFFRLKMKAVAHTNGTVDCSDGKIHMKYKIEREIPIKCIGKLIKEGTTKAAIDNHIHIYTTDKVLHVLVSLPSKGVYHLKLFAGEADTEEKDQLPVICSYVINCAKEQETYSVYPKQYKKWSPGFYLHSPTEGQLYVGETYPFKISLPGIIEMAVCLGGKKSSWLRLSNTTGVVWEGDVTMEAGTERVSVLAKFDKQVNNTFSSLLEYQVLEKT